MSTEILEKETAFKRWYRENKEALSLQRKARYHNDPDYRAKVLAQAKEWRKSRPKKGSTVVVPPEYTHDYNQAAEEVGINTGTLRDWKRKKYYPQPSLYGGSFYLTDAQVYLLSKIKTFFDEHGSRRGARTEEFENLKAFISANW